MALVRDVDQDPGQELQRIGGLGARGGPLRLVGSGQATMWMAVCADPLTPPYLTILCPRSNFALYGRSP